MDFSNTWRRRQACMRCRHLKVRCEYASPASASCIRCTRSNVQCINVSAPGESYEISNGSGGNAGRASAAAAAAANGLRSETSSPTGDQPAPPASAQQVRYLETLLSDAKRELATLSKAGTTPLARAFAINLYSEVEAADHLAQFLELRTGMLQRLELGPSLAKADAEMPWTTVTIVTIMALSTSPARARERLAVLDPLLTMAAGIDEKLPTEDSHLALAIMCMYALPYGARALLRLHALHAATVHILHSMTRGSPSLGPVPPGHDLPLGVHIAATCIINMQIAALGFSLVHCVDLYVTYFGSILHKCHNESAIMGRAARCTHAASDVIRRSNCPVEIRTVYEQTITEVSMLQAEIDVVPLPLYVSKLKFTTLALGVFLALEPETPQRQELLTAMAHQAQNDAFTVTSQLTQGSVARSPLRPAFMYFLVEDLLVCMMLLRFYVFALGIDLDVNVDLLVETLSNRWRDELNDNHILKQLFVVMIKVRDLSALKIGAYNSATQMVDGPGSMDKFYLYYQVDPRDPGPPLDISRCELQSFMSRGVIDIVRAPNQGRMAPQDTAVVVSNTVSSELLRQRISYLFQYI